MKVQHVPQTAISQRRAKDRNVVLVSPIAYGSLIVDFSAQPMDDGARRPHEWHIGLPGCFLLFEHPVEDWDDPVFKSTIVAVRDDEVPNPIHALRPQFGSKRRKGT